VSEEKFEASEYTKSAVRATFDWISQNDMASVDTDSETFLDNPSVAMFLEVYTQLVINSVLAQGENESDS